MRGKVAKRLRRQAREAGKGRRFYRQLKSAYKRGRL